MCGSSLFTVPLPFFHFVVGVGGRGKRKEKGWGWVEFLTRVWRLGAEDAVVSLPWAMCLEDLFRSFEGSDLRKDSSSVRRS